MALARRMWFTLFTVSCHKHVNTQFYLFVTVSFPHETLPAEQICQQINFHVALLFFTFPHFQESACGINLTCHIGVRRVRHRFSFMKYFLPQGICQGAVKTTVAPLTTNFSSFLILQRCGRFLIEVNAALLPNQKG